MRKVRLMAFGMALMIVLLPMIPQFIGGKNYNAPTLHGGKLPQMINCFSGGVGMKKKKTFLIIMILLLLLICVAILFSFGRSPENILLPSDKNAEEWNGKQNLPNGAKSESKTIKIPGFDSLAFTAGQKEQKVNFFNPEENDCLFRMTLFVDDKQYWQSGYVEPGKGYYNITLDDTFESGNYNAYLFVECFKEEGKALNSAKVEFQMKVVE